MKAVYPVDMKSGIDGHRVRQLREDLGWTQEDLARAVSKMIGAINQSSISHVGTVADPSRNIHALNYELPY
jgi:transcriptional regulator with XRE-family HTH domain